MAGITSSNASAGSLWSWIPVAEEMYKDLVYNMSPEVRLAFRAISDFKGMQFSWKSDNVVNPTNWSVWMGENWAIPLTAVALYFIAIVVLKAAVAKYGPYHVRDIAFYWNAFLSVFSWCGVFACVPVLVGSLFRHGLYFTTCAQPMYFGTGICGLFVILFVLSKLAELLDTILLVLGRKPVLALQWWHHSTVLLYCWHSYASHIGTGLWFAAMNYAVHSVMYGYFALTATKYRKAVAPYAIFITLGQLAQMLVGIFVTVNAVMHQVAGDECHVNKTNSILGLLMYFSYFVLFMKLFVDSYVTGNRKSKQRPSVTDAKSVEASGAGAATKKEL